MQFVALVVFADEPVALLVNSVLDEGFTARHLPVFKVEPVVYTAELDKSSSCLFCPPSFRLLGVSVQLEHLLQELLLYLDLCAAMFIKMNLRLIGCLAYVLNCAALSEFFILPFQNLNDRL
jgi:hypothetical protein